MMSNPSIQQGKQKPVIETKVLLLWLFLVSVSMIFAGLTSAFIVAKGDRPMMNVMMPAGFYMSSASVVLSSVFIQFAYLYAKRNDIPKIRVFLLIGLIFGVAFAIFQLLGYQQLRESGFFFVGENTMSSFVYAITGIHLAHMVSGIIVLIVNFVRSLQYKIHSKNMLGIRLCTTYWHFLTAVWIYLFLFFHFYNA